MNELIKNNVQMMSQPVAAFVTFTNIEAKERARKYYMDGRFRSLGVTLKIKEAPEPE